MRSTVSPAIDRGESYSRSCVSAIGPDSELSIGSTPKATVAVAVASATA
jgi:hypothetical protein